MGDADRPVFVFGVPDGPQADGLIAFPAVGPAEAFLDGYLFSESAAMVMTRRRSGRGRLVVYTIDGQRLTPSRAGRFRSLSLVATGPLDDAGLQARLDGYAAARGLPVPVADRSELAGRLVREGQERGSPPLPRWLARWMPRPGPPPEG